MPLSRNRPSRALPHARGHAGGRLGWAGFGWRDLDRDRCAGLVYEPPERLVGRLAARPTGALMSVARSVADVLDGHVVFEVESIDRM
jgi:hypothetical protein